MKKKNGFRGTKVTPNECKENLMNSGKLLMVNTSFKFSTDIKKVETLEDEIESDKNVIVYAKKGKSYLTVTFNEIGYGWLMENSEYAESIQIYKSETYNNYYIINDYISKEGLQSGRHENLCFGKDKLYKYLENFFYNGNGKLEGISKFLTKGMDDDFFNNIYDKFELDKN